MTDVQTINKKETGHYSVYCHNSVVKSGTPLPDDATHCVCLVSIWQVPAHLESPARTQLQKVQRQQVKPFMTLDHQILNQSFKRSHPPTPSSELLVQHGHPSPESDTGLTGNPLTKLLTPGKEDDNTEWNVCLMNNLLKYIVF